MEVILLGCSIRNGRKFLLFLFDIDYYNFDLTFSNYQGPNDAEDKNRIIQVQEDGNVIPSETTKSHGKNENHRTVEGAPHQENNADEANAKEPPKASKSNGYSASVVNKYQLTNNRMNLPIQKKPKLSFEAALFGEHPTSSSKRNMIPEKLEKLAIKKATRKVSLTFLFSYSPLY